MRNQMYAAVLKGGRKQRSPGDLRYIEVNKPVPSENDVLVQVTACGYCQTDYKAITGIRSLPFTQPHIVGHEPAGIVAEVGRSVKGFKPGDRVALSPLAYCGECDPCKRGDEYTHFCESATVYGGDGPKIVKDGAFAEYIAVDKKSVYKIPRNISFESAALLEPLSGAWKGLYNSQFKENQDIVVIGVGGIGALVAGLAQFMGARNVVAVDCSSTALKNIENYGVEHFVDTHKLTGKLTYTSKDIPSITDNVYDILGKPPDIVFEAAGPRNAVELMLDMGGAWAKKPKRRRDALGVRMNVFGITTDGTIPFPFDAFHFTDGKLETSFNVSRFSLENALNMMKSGFDPSQIVTHKYTLEQIKAATATMGTSDKGKVMVFPNPETHWPK